MLKWVRTRWASPLSPEMVASMCSAWRRPVASTTNDSALSPMVATHLSTYMRRVDGPVAQVEHQGELLTPRQSETLRLIDSGSPAGASFGPQPKLTRHSLPPRGK